jgi:hypothetical protein
MGGVSFATSVGGGGTVVQNPLHGELIVMLESVAGPGLTKVVVVGQ